jgi:hypothetical protein
VIQYSQIKIVDGYGQELWFYRHSDGYPEGTMPTLEKFLSWVKEGKVRNNVSQAAGWLVLIGAEEYKMKSDYIDGKFVKSEKKTLTEPDNDDLNGWKCGAYEPCPPDSCGCNYLYIVDLEKKTITIEE